MTWEWFRSRARRLGGAEGLAGLAGELVGIERHALYLGVDRGTVPKVDNTTIKFIPGAGIPGVSAAAAGHRPADRHEVAAVARGARRDRGSRSRRARASARVELGDPVADLLELGLELEDLADPDQADALVGELLDALEQRDVAVGVAPAAALGAARLDEALALVDAQRLRVHAGELGRHRDDVERAFVGLLVVAHRLHPQVLARVAGQRRGELPRPPPSASSSSSVGHHDVERDEQVAGIARRARDAPAAHAHGLAASACPAGTFTVTGASSVGTFTCAPSAASGKVIGTFTVRSPLAAAAEDRVRARRARRRRGRRAARRCGRACRGPSPGCAGRRRRPAGMRTFTVRGRTSTPRPLQCLHLSLTTLPRPPQVGHTCENENGPWSTATAPEPPHVGQTLGERARLRAGAVAHASTAPPT